MKNKNTGPLSFRPWEENRERLEHAERLGASMSEVVNEVLKRHLRDYVVKLKESKAKQLHETLNTPVP